MTLRPEQRETLERITRELDALEEQGISSLWEICHRLLIEEPSA